MKELGKRLLSQDGLPEFEPVDLTLKMLMAEGQWREAVVAGRVGVGGRGGLRVGGCGLACRADAQKC